MLVREQNSLRSQLSSAWSGTKLFTVHLAGRVLWWLEQPFNNIGLESRQLKSLDRLEETHPLLAESPGATAPTSSVLPGGGWFDHGVGFEGEYRRTQICTVIFACTPDRSYEPSRANIPDFPGPGADWPCPPAVLVWGLWLDLIPWPGQIPTDSLGRCISQ